MRNLVICANCERWFQSTIRTTFWISAPFDKPIFSCAECDKFEQDFHEAMEVDTGEKK